MEPIIIKGNRYQDERGTICYNNDFKTLGVKRVYTIVNINADFIRGWQGHKIEQRWFSAIAGSFTIRIVKIDCWDQPSKNLPVLEFVVDCSNMDVVHIPKGYANSIQANEEQSKLLVLSDYELGEVQDEFRFPVDYFN